jgi:WD40 repeat protein
LKYAQCRTTVSPPTDFDPASIPRSAQTPASALSLAHAAGFSANLPCPNLSASAEGCLIFAAAAVVVVLDPATGHQRLFCGHDETVSAVAVDNHGVCAASGQTGSAPMVLLWDIKTLQVKRRLGDGFFEQCVFCLAFGGNGSFVVTVGRTERQYLGVWDTATGGLMAEMAATAGKSPAVHTIVCEPHTADEHLKDGRHEHFVTVGNNGNAVFYTFDRGAVAANTGGGGLLGVPLKRTVGILGKFDPLMAAAAAIADADYTAQSGTDAAVVMNAACFVENKGPADKRAGRSGGGRWADGALVATGASDGKVYLWSSAECVGVFKADEGSIQSMACVDGALYTG